MQSLAFLGWSAPLAAAMALRLFAPRRFARMLAPLHELAARRLPTLVGPTAS